MARIGHRVKESMLDRNCYEHCAIQRANLHDAYLVYFYLGGQSMMKYEEVGFGNTPRGDGN